MSRAMVAPNPVQKKVTLVLGLLLLVVVGGIAAVVGLAWQFAATDRTASPAQTAAPASAAPVTAMAVQPNASASLPPLSPAKKIIADKLAAEQAVAATAAVQQAGTRASDGPITSRPAFVSEIEWQVLQSVAMQSPDKGAELTRLVNNLRFSKQLEQWRALAGSPDMALRGTLARQLLDDLPARVKDNALDMPQAQALQPALLLDAVSDPAERTKRAEAESRRLAQVASPAVTDTVSQ